MAQIKFYQNEDGVFFFGNRTANPGSIQLIRKSESTVNFQVNSSFDYFTEDLNIEDVLDKNGDPTYSSFEDIISKNKNFFLKAPASNGGGSTLDFLFVDAWFDENDGAPFNPTSANQFAISFLEDNWSLLISAFADESWGWTGYAGAGSDPYVPISKNTIFVHPTTFERYRFNGTTMEVYNDVDNVVPKWRTYKALLTQQGENAPVARVLNQDEPDYLGDIKWVRNYIGQYTGEIILNENLTEILHKSSYANNLFELYIDDNINYSGSQRIFISTNVEADTPSDYLLYNFPIEIKVRQRGAPPKLLSAETNAAGDKVILTFDKKIQHSYFGSFSITSPTSVLGVDTIKDNVVTILLDGILQPDEVITCSLSQTDIESLDYGLLQPFENFPVVNKVV